MVATEEDGPSILHIEIIRELDIEWLYVSSLKMLFAVVFVDFVLHICYWFVGKLPFERDGDRFCRD